MNDSRKCDLLKAEVAAVDKELQTLQADFDEVEIERNQLKAELEQARADSAGDKRAAVHGCYCEEDSPAPEDPGHFASCARGKLEAKLGKLQRQLVDARKGKHMHGIDVCSYCAIGDLAVDQLALVSEACGLVRSASPERVLKEVQARNDECSACLVAVASAGCFTGDCSHDKSSECVVALQEYVESLAAELADTERVGDVVAKSLNELCNEEPGEWPVAAWQAWSAWDELRTDAKPDTPKPDEDDGWRCPCCDRKFCVRASIPANETQGNDDDKQS